MNYVPCAASIKVKIHVFRLCGHKDIKSRIDSRAFGFPFDRKFDFDISESKE